MQNKSFLTQTNPTCELVFLHLVLTAGGAGSVLAAGIRLDLPRRYWSRHSGELSSATGKICIFFFCFFLPHCNPFHPQLSFVWLHPFFQQFHGKENDMNGPRKIEKERKGFKLDLKGVFLIFATRESWRRMDLFAFKCLKTEFNLKSQVQQ